MSLPSAVTRPATSRLPGAPVDAPPNSGAPGPRPSARVRARAVAGRIARKVARPFIGSFQQRLDLTEHRIGALERMPGELADLEIRVAQLGQINVELHGLSVNQELLKAEIRSVQGLFVSMGEAVAPGAGFDGIASRFAELRERVNGLERRTRATLTEASGSSDAPRATAEEGLGAPRAGSAAPPSTVTSELFDYVGFEQRFRGNYEGVVAKLRERYLVPLRSAGPVLDVGCGRGELLELLRAEGVEAYGIDTDASVVAEAQAAGLDVRRADAARHLQSIEPASLGAIVSTQVIEHLEFGVLLEFLDLARSRLRPGGLFIAETPNPGSLIVLSYSYILDPTHVRPLHPALMSFLCESAGFRDLRLEFFSPAEELWLDHVDAPDAPEWVAELNTTIDRLNGYLFGPQDYAVIARTPETDPSA